MRGLLLIAALACGCSFALADAEADRDLALQRLRDCRATRRSCQGEEADYAATEQRLASVSADVGARRRAAAGGLAAAGVTQQCFAAGGTMVGNQCVIPR
jgi:hypothetical protein